MSRKGADPFTRLGCFSLSAQIESSKIASAAAAADLPRENYRALGRDGRTNDRPGREKLQLRVNADGCRLLFFVSVEVVSGSFGQLFWLLAVLYILLHLCALFLSLYWTTMRLSILLYSLNYSVL